MVEKSCGGGIVARVDSQCDDDPAEAAADVGSLLLRVAVVAVARGRVSS